jgi:hypothetical protein
MQFRCRPQHGTFLQLACLVERITRNIGGKIQTGRIILDVTKTFDTVWFGVLLYKLTLLNAHIKWSIRSHHTSEVERSTVTSRRPRNRVVSCGLALLMLN